MLSIKLGSYSMQMISSEELGFAMSLSGARRNCTGLAKAGRNMIFTVVVLIKNVTATCLEQPYLGLYRCVLILEIKLQWHARIPV